MRRFTVQSSQILEPAVRLLNTVTLESLLSLLYNRSPTTTTTTTVNKKRQQSPEETFHVNT